MKTEIKENTQIKYEWTTLNKGKKFILNTALPLAGAGIQKMAGKDNVYFATVAAMTKLNKKYTTHFNRKW